MITATPKHIISVMKPWGLAAAGNGPNDHGVNFLPDMTEWEFQPFTVHGTTFYTIESKSAKKYLYPPSGGTTNEHDLQMWDIDANTISTFLWIVRPLPDRVYELINKACLWEYSRRTEA